MAEHSHGPDGASAPLEQGPPPGSAAAAARSPKARGLWRVVQAIGPGLITGAADDDPSGIGTYVQTGAQLGYAQLWTALFVLPLLTAVQEASARVGAVTGHGLAAVMRDRYGVIALGTLVGLVINFIGLNPVKMLIVAAVVNGIVAPPLLAVLAVTARSSEVMGRYRCGWLSTGLVWLACIGMAAAAVGLLLSVAKP